MNNIAEAAEKLRNGWCQHDIHKSGPDGDKFCAVGALGTTLLGELVTRKDVETLDEYLAWEDKCYKAAETSEEGKIIAKVIAEQYPEKYGPDSTMHYAHKEHQYQEIIYLFNDRADNVDEVLTVFDKAAVIYDELHG